MNKARVGIMIPVYNTERYIAESVHSILNQTHTDWHLYIADDCSTDGTLKIIEDLVGNNPRVTIIKHPENQGNPKNRNSLLQAAAGHKYLAILDADDIAEPERLEQQVSFLDKNPKVSLLGSAVTIIDEYGKEQGIRNYPESHKAIKKSLLVFDPFAQPAVMFRSSVLDSVDKYDEGLARCQDYDLFIRMIRAGHVAHNLPEPLTRFRIFNSQGKYKNLSKAFFYSLKVRTRHLFSRDCFSLRGFFMWCVYLGGFVSSKIFPPKLFAFIFDRLFVRKKS